MARPFNELRERLLRVGVAPRHVRRYLTELADHLADLRAEEEHAGRNRAEAESAPLVRLGGMDDLAKAMTERRQFQSWCGRAPWAMFGLAPLFFLAGAYFVACFYLWCGWKIFLPGADTPFGGGSTGPIYGFANIYFQAGRLYYFCAPVLVGWGIGLVAARQRLKVGLAHARVGRDRMDGRHRPNSRQSNRGARRTRTYQHELLHPWALWPGCFRRSAACPGDFHDHGAAVSHLAITKG